MQKQVTYHKKYHPRFHHRKHHFQSQYPKKYLDSRNTYNQRQLFHPKRKYHFLLYGISIFLILFSGFHISLWLIDYYQTIKLSKQLQNQATVSETEEILDSSFIHPPEDQNDRYWDYVNLDFLQVDFTSLRQENPDTIAWIEVLGTSINYPVVQTDNNDYYLTHSFDHRKNEAGWIFADYRNQFDELNDNSIIYGHGRWDGTMFGSLKQVLEDGWFLDYQNHVIRLSTLHANMIFQIFSVYTIYKESYYMIPNFSSLLSYQTFLDTIQKRSKFTFPTTVNTNDKILTLSTCQDNDGNRIVVHAKLIRKGILPD